MNYINKNYLLIILFFALLLSSCANMVSPSGGEKDITSPVLLKSTPVLNSTNFKDKNIELVFDEYINLKDIQNQFIISPSNITAEVKKDGKKIKIVLSEYPKENTTYILNFGDAISDYTENNINKDFKFIFSTSENIDSLSISGNVLDAYKLEAVAEAVVCLYTVTDNDSVVYKKKPDYTVRTNKLGEFKFTNLKSNTYKLFVLLEENNNKVFDSQEESIAFSDTLINLNKNIQLFNILLFKEEAQKRKLVSKSITYQKVELIYNKENNIELVDLNSKIDTVIYSEKRDTINIYYTENADSTALYLKEDDKIDTLKIKFAKNLKKRDFVINVENKINQNSILITSYDLFDIYNADSLVLFEDSIKVKYDLSKIAYNKFKLSYAFDPLKKYYITITDSTFMSFQKIVNTKNQTNISYKNEEEYGSLNIITNNNENIIYELLNDKNEVVRRSVNVKNIEYKFLPPGSYRLRSIYDANKNNKWDTGNYLKKLQPEKVEYYLNPIKIRANWDMEIKLIP